MYNYESKLVDSSRMVADILVNDVGNDLEKFSEMLDIAMLDIYPVSMRAARVVSLCVEKNPKIVDSFQARFIQSLKKVKVDGVKRSFLKIIAETPELPDEESTGLLADIAFSLLADPGQAIAIRYYCIEILFKIIKSYPELGEELSLLLTDLEENESAGLKSKATATLQQLKKIKKQ